MSDEEACMKIHTYTYDVNIPNQDSSKTRRLNFDGYNLNGRVDLTNISKATGEAMWPCCALLADYLNESTNLKDTVSTKDDSSPFEEQFQILELGCGLGLAGAVASVRFGPSSRIVMTDGDVGVVERAKQISELNYVEGEDAKTIHDVLWWGDQEQMQKMKENTNDGIGFDLVIASDVIYDSNAEVTAKNFSMTVDYLLKRNSKRCQPKCLVAFQQRSVDVDIFYKAFHKIGFDVRVPDGDYYEDIFGERHDERTCFTDKFLLCFERRLKIESEDFAKENLVE